MSYQVQVTMTAHQVWKRFKEYNRAESFTEAGLEAILNNMQEASEGDGVLVIDVIAICGDYSEGCLAEVFSQFDLNPSDYLNCDTDADFWDSDGVYELIYPQELLKDLNSKVWAELLWNGNIVYRNL